MRGVLRLYRLSGRLLHHLSFAGAAAIAVALLSLTFLTLPPLLEDIAFIALGIVPLTLPFVAVFWFMLGLVAGEEPTLGDAGVILVGLLICAFVVVIGVHGQFCAPDSPAEVHRACVTDSVLFTVDQFSKGAFNDVFDVFELRWTDFDIRQLPDNVKWHLLAFRLYANAAGLLLILAAGARLRGKVAL
jgi:hypothetical protein